MRADVVETGIHSLAPVTRRTRSAQVVYAEVDAVLVEQVDRVHFEAPERGLGHVEAELGGDHHLVAQQDLSRSSRRAVSSVQQRPFQAVRRGLQRRQSVEAGHWKVTQIWSAGRPSFMAVGAVVRGDAGMSR